MDTKYDVYFYEAFAEEADEIRKYLPADINAGFTDLTIQESAHTAPGADVISTRTQSAFPASWAASLQGILTRSTGYDHVRDYIRSIAPAHNIATGYLPLYCNRAVAEQAMLFWMALLRKLPLQLSQFASFNRDGITGRECFAKEILVVGVGNIGHQIIRIARGLAMIPLGVDIVRKHTDVDYVDIDSHIHTADIIVCAMNLTDQNAGYFSRDLLKRTKPGVIFVNIARGELAPARGLLELVDTGHLGGVALDVYEDEKRLAVSLRAGSAPADTNTGASTAEDTADDTERDSTDPTIATLQLAARQNVITTPHNAFNTAESVARKAAQSIESITHFLQTGQFTNPIEIA